MGQNDLFRLSSVNLTMLYLIKLLLPKNNLSPLARPWGCSGWVGSSVGAWAAARTQPHGRSSARSGLAGQGTVPGSDSAQSPGSQGCISLAEDTITSVPVLEGPKSRNLRQRLVFSWMSYCTIFNNFVCSEPIPLYPEVVFLLQPYDPCLCTASERLYDIYLF